MPVSSYILMHLFLNVPTCLVLIEPSLKPNFGILGITFLENFTQYYSPQHNQFALVPNDPSNATIKDVDIP